jgi:carboxylesterase
MSKLAKLLSAAGASTIRSISKPEMLYPAPGTSKDQAVLLLHGFTGSPHDMRYLGQRLQAAGYTVSIPRLPGHGTNRADFLQTTAEDWLRRSMDAWMDLQILGLPQHLAGLSMGGILASILAAVQPAQRLVLAAPALMTTNSLLTWTPLLKQLVAFRKRATYQRYDDADLDYLSREYWSVDMVAPAAELYRLQRMGCALLPRVRCPLLTIVSRKDSSVPMAVLPWIESAAGSSVKEHLVLENSSHVVVNDSEKEAVADAIIAWFDKPLDH